jgi:hypothetical protein
MFLHPWSFIHPADQSLLAGAHRESSVAGEDSQTGIGLESACVGYWAERCPDLAPASCQSSMLHANILSSNWEETQISEPMMGSDLAMKFDEACSEMQEAFNEQNAVDKPWCFNIEQDNSIERITTLGTSPSTVSPWDLQIQQSKLVSIPASASKQGTLLPLIDEEISISSALNQEKQITCVWPSCPKSFSSRSSYKSGLLILLFISTL